MQTIMLDRFGLFAGLIIGTIVLCATFIIVTRPWLTRYALVYPNIRSSHDEPTPQGGGIAVVLAILIVTILAEHAFGVFDSEKDFGLSLLLIATGLLAALGAVDDIRPLPHTLRLFFQGVAVIAVLTSLPNDLRVIPLMPWLIERGLILIGLLWLINLTNFMDGIDWMTVAETVPLTGALTLLGFLAELPLLVTIISLVLLGAMLGFAPFNRPVAKLFLGDSGSLPIGLLLGWLLLQVAGAGYIVAALLLPLYYLADATITLGRRIGAGEPFWQAHRSHFYQRANDNGYTVLEIVTRVFLANLALATLALGTVARPDVRVDIASAILGAILVSWLLWRFAKGKTNRA